MTYVRAEFQEAAVEHIVRRLADPAGSRRVLLADEVGLGKTVVARGVIERLLERRRRPLTVVYLCSNAEIAEQNRQKLDPEGGVPIGRVTELALRSKERVSQLRLFSFTPGTSLKDGTGLEGAPPPDVPAESNVSPASVEARLARVLSLRSGAGSMAFEDLAPRTPVRLRSASFAPVANQPRRSLASEKLWL